MIKAFDEIIEFIAAGSTSAEVIEFRPSAEAKERVHSLIRKEKDTGLLPEEQSELDDYMKLEHLMRMAKARAKLRSVHE